MGAGNRIRQVVASSRGKLLDAGSRRLVGAGNRRKLVVADSRVRLVGG